MTHLTVARLFTVALSFLLSWTALAACPSSPGRFVANGAEVTDTSTGLIWQRCSAGQDWSGSACTGTFSTYDHEAAFSYARTNAGSQGWRLPDVKELASLADKGCSSPAIDATVFVNTRSTVYWSSSPRANLVGYAWGINFYSGGTSYVDRNSFNVVRLVRTSQ